MTVVFAGDMAKKASTRDRQPQYCQEVIRNADTTLRYY